MKIFLSLIVISVFVTAFSVGIDITHELPAPIDVHTNQDEGVQLSTTSIFFVGDIMLGRHTENLMQTIGLEYPFLHILKELEEPDITIGNFEGVVTKEHIQAKPMTFQFSVREEYLQYLRSIGFDVLSLANNHALDYGKNELSYTRSLCTRISILCGGTPNAIDEFTTIVTEVNSKKIGFIFLHTLYSEPDAELLNSTLSDLQSQSDMQIAYVHWGDEYVRTHNASQETLAHALIDNGVDVVVGHHPHVIQDIELYKGKPIFYSLGNFIFDQYFSTDVQEELGVKMLLSSSTVQYELVPFSSLETRSQPHRMSEKDAHTLYARILEKIKNEPGVNVDDGIITLPL